MSPLAVYAGTFDPLTIGHEDLMARGLRISERLIIGIGVNSSKVPIFTVEERVAMIQEVTRPYGSRVEVIPFQGLLVTFMKKMGATISIRGLRAVTDFEYELGIAHANAEQAPDIETIFLPTKPSMSFISSSVVREFARHGASVEHYVSPIVEAALKAKFTK